VAAFAPLAADDPRQVGRYRIVARLGHGGMGRVYLGRSPGGRAVAVKVVRPELAEDPAFRRRFDREVRAARRVTGFFTAAVVDADPDGDPPWLATAYVPGLSLAEAVAEHGPWPVRSVRALGAGLAEALEAIHRAEVVHRDLKPSNVLLAADGPRVIDFGISLAAEATTTALTQTGAVIGTPGYMSPEQLVGTEVGPPSDVFSLGAVLAFAATGTGPFGSTSSPHALNYRVVHEPPDLSSLPPELEIVARCLAKDPAARPGLPEVVDELGRAPGEPGTGVFSTEADWLPEPVAGIIRAEAGARPLPEPLREPAPPPGAESPPAPWPPSAATFTPAAPEPPARRSRRLTALATAVVVGLGAAFALGIWLGGGDEEPATASGGGAGSEGPDGGGTNSGGADGGADGGNGEEPELLIPAELWSFPANVCSAPAAADGTVYVGGYDNTLYALDAATGEEIWTYTTDGPVCAAPTVTDGTVYFASDDGRAYAVDAESGEELWWYETHDWMRSSPAVADGVAYFGGDDGDFRAVDALTGDELWTYGPNDWVRSSPAVADGLVYFGSNDDYFNVLNVEDGSFAWSYTTGGDVVSSPAIADGVVYFGSDDGTVYAMDAATGEEIWTFATPDWIQSSPVVADGVVYIGCDDGNVYALSAGTGEELWRFTTGDWVRSDLAVGDGVVWAGSDDGNVYALDAETGALLARAESEDYVRSLTVDEDGTAYFGPDSGDLRAVTLP
jgi:outer membrane protein assembly factor BamB